jgi:hypothetical protein
MDHIVTARPLTVNRSWEKELEGVETYCQRHEKMEGTHRQPYVLDGTDFIIIIIILFRVVFWDILPCKMIVDRCFRGAYIILAAVRT